MSESSKGSWSEIFAPRYFPSTATLGLGVGLLAFNAFLASTALPTAVKELHGVALISWATTLYLVFAIMGGAAAALLKQRLGARLALLLSATGFLAGTLIAAHAGSMPEVVAGRMLQGLGEGVVAAIAYSLIPDLFPSRLVPRVFGIQAAIWGIAAFGGPVGVGFVTQAISWRAAFLINVPLILIFALLVAFVAPNRRSAAEAVGFPGLRLITIGVGILLVAVANVAPPALAAALLVAAAVVLVGVVFADRRGRTRIFPAGAFSLRSVVGTGLWVVLLLPIGATAAEVYLVLILQQLWGYGPLLAGAIGALSAIGWSFSALAVSGVGRETWLGLVRTGAALVALGIAGILAALWSGQLGILLLALLTMGTGFGFSWNYLGQTMMEAAGPTERDRTTALLPTTQSAGSAIGAALAGLVANAAGFAVATTPDELHRAVVPMLVMALSFAVIAFAAALRTTGLAARHAPVLAPDLVQTLR